jgi:hypothetical protein
MGYLEEPYNPRHSEFSRVNNNKKFDWGQAVA